MVITGINNNADSVRVHNHGTMYTKAGLLAYARNVNDAKFADVSVTMGKSTLTHEIVGGGMSIEHKKPKRMEHTLFIHQRLPFYDCNPLDDDEFLHNIIAMGNSSNNEFNVGDYNILYEKIMDGVVFGDIECELQFLADVESYYKNATEMISDYLGIKVSPYQTGKLKKYIRKYNDWKFHHGAPYGEEDLVADCMTLFTPYTWTSDCITGVVQREWTDIIYPKELYDKCDIDMFEAFYFNKYMEYEAEFEGENYWYTFCDFVGEDTIINDISGEFPTDKVKYYSYW